MSETSKKNNDRSVKNPLSQRRKIRYARSETELNDMRREPPKKNRLGKNRKAECDAILGTRCEERDPSGWDVHKMGIKETPAETMRARAYYDQESRGFKHPEKTAKLLGTSLSFVKKWTRIGRAAKDSGHSIRNSFRALPTKRLNAPKGPSTEQVRTVIDIRRNNPVLGSKKIAVLMPEGIRLTEYAIANVLREHNLITLRGKYKKRTYVRFRSPFPMHTIQLDFKTWENGTHSIWALDDHSRAILGFRVVREATADVVIDLMKEIIRKYGTPIRVLTDHGCQFTTMHEDGEHRFEKWLTENNITHIMGRVGHPQTQGKIERSHGTAIIEASYFGPAETIEEWSSTIALWIEYYNNRRPHMSLDHGFPIRVFENALMERDSEEWLKAVKDPWVTAYA